MRGRGLRGLCFIVVSSNISPQYVVKLVTCVLNVEVGSSQGRGPRCAGWFQDYVLDIGRFGKKSTMEVRVLKGGIKGWVKEFEGSMMEGFEEEYWEQFKNE